MKKTQVIIDYKRKRDVELRNNNLPIATYYQIHIMQEIEDIGFYFHKRNDLKQQKYIMQDMLEELLDIKDVDYQNGIINEIALSEMENCLSGTEEICEICSKYFEKSKISEYVWGAYCLHINIILKIASENMEKAGKYTRNLLTLLKIRYGTESWQYAKMKLHIVGEYYYHFDKRLFCSEFENNYDYFKQHTAERDSFFCDTVLFYAGQLVETGSEKLELWVERSEQEAERWQESEIYGFYKCKNTWLRAKILEKRNQDKEALKILQEIIANYIEKNCDNKNLFYGPIYILAAEICRKDQKYDQMFQYAQEGLKICERLSQADSEWYYEIYNYVGIWHMSQYNWGDAEKLYGNSLQNIERKIGKESDVYILFLCNLAEIEVAQGKNALPYYEEFERIRSKKDSFKYVSILYIMLKVLISSSAKIDDIEKAYKVYIENIGNEDRPQFDTIYMVAKASAGKFDEEFKYLAKRLQNKYQNNFTEEMAIVYWKSILTWQWRIGCLDKAFNISKKLMEQIENTKDGRYISTVVNHIQLLVLNKQYNQAEKQTLFVLNWLYDCILDIGCGDISQYLVIMRILLSIYIHSLKRGGKFLQLDQETKKLLLEKIICCKTIEREMRGFLGKYDKGEQIELRRYKALHRKLAALEIWKKGGPDAKGYTEEEQFREKEIRCLLEQSEYRESVNREILFHKKIHQYRLGEINLPYNSVCVEYFAYYHFCPDVPMVETEIESGTCNFLVFILKEENQHKIENIIDIPLKRTLENELIDLREMTKYPKNSGKEKGKTANAIQYLQQIIAEPVLKYLDKQKRIYLGLDFILQYLPMDLIFSNSQGEPLNVTMVESVRYAGEDSKIHFKEANALVIGNPQINYLNEKDGRMPCGELESMEIARMFGTKAYVGKEACHRLLWGKESSAVIHICAHGGLLDENEDTFIQSSLFTDSFLMLAGYIDWKEGCKIRDYGNGVLSGDDFLFMDLSKTKLVVLSACISGLGYSKGLQSIRGMRWAIGAAGAENSITTLWEISDVAGGLLMVMFYRNLQSMPISEALYQAKKSLRTITVEELRKDSVLWSIIKIGEKGLEKRFRAKDKPYSHWRNWAAFVHYHR